jgi:hypothetical protein
MQERPQGIRITKDSRSTNQLSVSEEIELKFGSAKSKQDVIHALENCHVLHRIPLDTPINVSIEQSFKDFSREKVLLNDVPFIPDKLDNDRSMAFVQTVSLYVSRLARMAKTKVFDDNLYNNVGEVSNILLQRACRTSAGSDSFFTVQKMLCIEGTFLTQKTLVDDPPVHIDVFLAPKSALYSSTTNNEAGYSEGEDTKKLSGRLYKSAELEYPTQFLTSLNRIPDEDQLELCARIQVSNSFAIFDVDSIDEIMGNEAEDPIPWLEIETVVMDESNFKEGKHWRKLHLIVTDAHTGITYTSSEAIDPIVEAARASSGRISTGSNYRGSSNTREGNKVFRELSHWFSPNRPISSTTHATEESNTATNQSSAIFNRGAGAGNQSDVASVGSSRPNSMTRP